MKLFFIVMLILSGLFTNAQTADSITRYYNAEYKITDTPARMRYVGISVFKDSVWRESTYYYPSLQLSSYAKYKDKELTIHVDSFYSFHITGALRNIGNYINGKKDGIWLKYHADGSTWDSANYVNGKPINTSLSWHANGFRSDSIVWSENGATSFSWNDEGRIQSIGYFNLDEKRQGSWNFYYANGKMSSAEIYNNGELKDIKSFDENGNLISNDGLNTKLEVESEYPGGLPAWARFLNKNIHYPKDAIKKEIEGLVVVQFLVNKDGEISGVEAISGPVELREESVRLIKRSGKWNPAVYHGVKVKSYKKQPFVFRLH